MAFIGVPFLSVLCMISGNIPRGVHLKNIITGATSHTIRDAISAKLNKNATVCVTHGSLNFVSIDSKNCIRPKDLTISSGVDNTLTAMVPQIYSISITNAPMGKPSPKSRLTFFTELAKKSCRYLCPCHATHKSSDDKQIL